ncbi:hypothetical protein MD588_10405 [Photobacterium sp. SDRW27]|uniref:hypothetical protein n=1 Tax=Photobacterium obscurum TaxID=2829490 RepID=UPI002243E8F2|nr:hypothetical protein [Photobacterium obscurum]MCW8329218.1 hypothetical protein [Photobacterium obscurum]
MKLKPIFNLSIVAASMALVIGCNDSSSDTPKIEKETVITDNQTPSTPLILTRNYQVVMLNAQQVELKLFPG